MLYVCAGLYLVFFFGLLYRQRVVDNRMKAATLERSQEELKSFRAN